MHEGSIFKDTAEGRLYRYLQERKGQMCDAWIVTTAIKTTAVATHSSGVNKQLRIRGIQEEVKCVQKGRDFFYVLLDLPVTERAVEQLVLV